MVRRGGNGAKDSQILKFTNSIAVDSKGNIYTTET
jgi:hypothetical protein